MMLRNPFSNQVIIHLEISNILELSYKMFAYMVLLANTEITFF